MKKSGIVTVIILIFFGMTFVSSCHKSGNSTPAYFMKATYGSPPFGVNNCYAYTTGNTLTISSLPLPIALPTYPYIYIWIGNWNGAVGTYSLDSAGTQGLAEYISCNACTELSQSGSLVITAVSSSGISGKFLFTATDGTILSNGSFTAQRE